MWFGMCSCVMTKLKTGTLSPVATKGKLCTVRCKCDIWVTGHSVVKVGALNPATVVFGSTSVEPQNNRYTKVLFASWIEFN